MWQDFLLAFFVSALYILTVTVQYGYIADRQTRGAVFLEPVIALCGAVGILQIVKGPFGVAGYVLGSTLGCALAMLIRRKHGRK